MLKLGQLTYRLCEPQNTVLLHRSILKVCGVFLRLDLINLPLTICAATSLLVGRFGVHGLGGSLYLFSNIAWIPEPLSVYYSRCAHRRVSGNVS
jgi:Na+/H+ antiporter NhaB